MTRRTSDFFDETRRPPSQTRGCDHPGCAESGAFRAPRSRMALGALDSYYWFCLTHVRAYNAAWNYYAGMSEAEIEANLRQDTVWQRPTWRLGWRTAQHFKDPLGVFSGDAAASAQQAKPRRVLTEEEKALIIFDIEPPFSLSDLKTRYKLLVKTHHPDANGGDKAAEERLKLITQAYALLKTRFFS